MSSTLSSSPVSHESVNRARLHAGNLIGDFSLSSNYPGAGGPAESATNSQLSDNLSALSSDIWLAWSDFDYERSAFGALTSRIEMQVLAALYFTRSQAVMAAKTGPTPSIHNHLLRVISHLAIAEDLMRTGVISPPTAAQAAMVNARSDVLIGPAFPSYRADGPGPSWPGKLGISLWAFSTLAFEPYDAVRSRGKMRHQCMNWLALVSQ